MKFPCSLFPALLALGVAEAQSIPVRTISPPIESKEVFSTRPAVRELPNGKTLVNDHRGKRLIVFDSSFNSFVITADSNGLNAAHYPNNPTPLPLIRYLGDSSLLIDFEAKSFLLVDADGRISRAVAHPKSEELFNVASTNAGTAAVDDRGRLIYRASGSSYKAAKPGQPPNLSTRDTLTIVRADFDTRLVDTVGTYTVPRAPGTIITDGPNGKPVGALKINVLPSAADDWVVLSDGTVAILREHDYHVDWIKSNGTKSSTSKLPYDWKLLTDADKQARIDSAKRVIDSLATTAEPYGWSIRSRRSADGGRSMVDTIIAEISFASPKEMRDYVPPIRNGALRADADGNLWVLPTTSMNTGPGILYDVINPKNQLFERVRIPAGYVVIGNGKAGVVYLARNVQPGNKWVIARSVIKH